MNDECWLGSISTMVAAFLAAVHGFHGFWPPEAASTSRKPLLLALRRYLAKSLGQFQVPTLQVLLSGWPIFQLLRRFPLRRFPGPTPESRELHRRAGRMSKTIGTCWAQEAWPNRWSCSCEAMRPVAKAAAGWSLKFSLIWQIWACPTFLFGEQVTQFAEVTWWGGVVRICFAFGMLTRRRAGHDIHGLSFCRRLESWPCDRLSKASRTWFRKSSLLAISHGCTAGSLHRAQQALLNLPRRLQTGEATGTSLSASQLLNEWHVFTCDLLCDLCAHCLKGQNVDDYLSTWHFMQASAGCLLFSKIRALHREERTN